MFLDYPEAKRIRPMARFSQGRSATCSIAAGTPDSIDRREACGHGFNRTAGCWSGHSVGDTAGGRRLWEQ